MLRSLFTFFAVSMMTQTLWASEFNQVCKFAYREASVRLLEEIETFKSKENASEDEKTKALVQLAISVTNLDVEVGIQRSTCQVFESADNQTCVTQYKEIYDNLRGRIRTAALISQNQSDVKLSLVNLLSIKTKLGYYDVRCDYSK